ncbi:MAG: hypothetical protein R3E51_00900 [Rhizobiaceae bacterium]
MAAVSLEVFTGCPQASLSEAGSIVEAGSREALIEKGGRFAEYWLQRRQAQDWRLV